MSPEAGCTPSSVTPVTESSFATFIDVGILREPVRPRATSHTTANKCKTLLTLWRVFSTAERLTAPTTARVAVPASAVADASHTRARVSHARTPRFPHDSTPRRFGKVRRAPQAGEREKPTVLVRSHARQPFDHHQQHLTPGNITGGRTQRLAREWETLKRLGPRMRPEVSASRATTLASSWAERCR